MRPGRFIALDIGAEGIGVAGFSQSASGKLELFAHDYAAFDSGAPEGMTREALVAITLRRLLAEKNYGCSKAVVALEGQSVFSRLVQLPPMGEAQREQTIKHEAVQNIPFPIEEVVWDAHTISGQAVPEVLLVAVKNELAGGVASAVSANGFSVEALTVAPAALLNAVRHAHPDLKVPALVVDVGARSSNLVFLDGDRPFFRTLPVSGEMMPRLLQEIERSIAFYISQQGGNSPEHIFLAGDLSGLERPEQVLTEKLALPVERFDPLAGVDCSDSVDEARRSCLGVLVGLAAACSAGGAVAIDLVPDALRQQQHMRSRLPLWAASVFVLVLLVGIWAWGLGRFGVLAKQELQELERHVAELERVEKQLVPLEEQVAELEGRSAVYREMVPRRTYWLRALAAVRDQLHEGMFLLNSSPIHVNSALAGLRVEVVSYLDREPEGEDVVKQLRNRLRADPFFSERTKVFKRPTKRLFARRFVLDLYFEEPMP